MGGATGQELCLMKHESRMHGMACGATAWRDSAAASIAQGATAAVLWACKHRRSTQLPAAQHILSPSTVCIHTFLSAAARCIIKTKPATQPQPPSHPEPTFLPVSIKRCF